MERIDQRFDPTMTVVQEDEIAKLWVSQANASPAQEVFEKALAEQWRKTSCDATGAPYVLWALIARLSSPRDSPFPEQSGAAKALASAFVDEASCPGAHGLSEFDKAALEKIAAPAAPQSPKP